MYIVMQFNRGYSSACNLCCFQATKYGISLNGFQVILLVYFFELKVYIHKIIVVISTNITGKQNKLLVIKSYIVSSLAVHT
jgi:hypothetical protein